MHTQPHTHTRARYQPCISHTQVTSQNGSLPPTVKCYFLRMPIYIPRILEILITKLENLCFLIRFWQQRKQNKRVYLVSNISSSLSMYYTGSPPLNYSFYQETKTKVWKQHGHETSKGTFLNTYAHVPGEATWSRHSSLCRSNSKWPQPQGYQARQGQFYLVLWELLLGVL